MLHQRVEATAASEGVVDGGQSSLEMINAFRDVLDINACDLISANDAFTNPRLKYSLERSNAIAARKESCCGFKRLWFALLKFVTGRLKDTNSHDPASNDATMTANNLGLVVAVDKALAIPIVKKNQCYLKRPILHAANHRPTLTF
jgi:hypothetical protein